MWQILMYQLFKIGGQFHPKQVDGRLLQTRAHETIYGAYAYDFQVNRSKLIIIAMNGRLHEVTYNCQSYLPWGKSRNIKSLLKSYDLDGQWRQISKSRFGTLYKSAGDNFYAAWCNRTKTFSFGTIVFHEEKYRIAI
jgi:hypothetical protein